MDDEELNDLFGMDDEDQGGEEQSDGPSSADPEESGSEPEESSSETAGDDGGVFVVTEEELDELFEDDGSEEDEPEPEDEGSYEEDDEDFYEEFEPQHSNKLDDIVEAEREFFKTFPLSAKSTLAIFLGLILIIIILLIATLPAFKILTINVEGNYYLKTEDIISMSGIQYGSHIFFADYIGASKTIEDSSAYVRGCKITFSIPSTVTIKVDERSKIANVRTPDGYASVDDNGIVLEMNSFEDGRNVAPVISGLNITHAAVGREIIIDNYSDYQKALIVMGALLAADTNSSDKEYSLFEHTKEVRVLPSGYIFLTIILPNKHTLQVKINSLEQISTDTAWLLYAIDSKVFNEGFPSGSLDMTGEEYVYRQFVIEDDTSEQGTDAEPDAQQ